MEALIRLTAKKYPCSDCAQGFQRNLEKYPPKLGSRKELTEWFCEEHNRVNLKLRKPQFDCSKVDERWRTGWKDGSCM